MMRHVALKEPHPAASCQHTFHVVVSVAVTMAAVTVAVPAVSFGKEKNADEVDLARQSWCHIGACPAWGKWQVHSATSHRLTSSPSTATVSKWSPWISGGVKSRSNPSSTTEKPTNTRKMALTKPARTSYLPYLRTNGEV